MEFPREHDELAPLYDAIAHFERVQNEKADFGAADTEPDAVWQLVLRSAARGQEYPNYHTGDHWELFTASMDCEMAAVSLTIAAKAAHRLIRDWQGRALSSEIERFRLAEEFLIDYCWRICWDCACGHCE